MKKSMKLALSAAMGGVGWLTFSPNEDDFEAVTKPAKRNRVQQHIYAFVRTNVTDNHTERQFFGDREFLPEL